MLKQNVNDNNIYKLDISKFDELFKLTKELQKKVREQGDKTSTKD